MFMEIHFQFQFCWVHNNLNQIPQASGRIFDQRALKRNCIKTGVFAHISIKQNWKILLITKTGPLKVLWINQESTDFFFLSEGAQSKDSWCRHLEIIYHKIIFLLYFNVYSCLWILIEFLSAGMWIEQDANAG